MNQRKSHHPFSFLKGIVMAMHFKLGRLIFIFSLLSLCTLANTEESFDIELSPVISFDEVAVDFNVNNFLRFETDVIISESNSIYINIEELFKNLDVKCIPSEDRNVLQGFIGNENTNYTINYTSKEIKLGNKTVKSTNGFMKESGYIYVESTILTKVFGLESIFNFRSLSIKMDSNFELPIQKKIRLDQMRANTSRLQSKSVVDIDTVIGREYHLFRAGVLDWSVSSTQSQNKEVNNRLRLRAGSEFLFGEATVGIDYYSQQDFDSRQLYYNWRWIDNDNKVIRQAELGKVNVQSIAYLKAPLVGASVSNSPNTVRRASGSYIVSDYTEPNWTVELYINDILVDYTEADASGYFVFEVPIVYGYTTLKMRFYGPLGEERMQERTMNTPYTLMPAGVMEYNATGGYIEDYNKSEFARGELNYGLNRYVTVGGGVEYLSSITNHSYMPFAVLAFQPFSKLLVNLEYDHNVSFNGLFNYTFARSAFLEIDYSKYVEGQQATLNTNNEALNVRLSLPLKVKKVSGSTTLEYNKLTYDEFAYNQLNALLSTRYKNFSANTIIASNWVSENDPYVTATLEMSQRMRNGLIMRPMAQYGLSSHEMLRAGVELEKRFARLSLSASYAREIKYNRDNIYFSLCYDLPFARAGATVAYNNNKASASEYAQGSLAFRGDHYTNTSNNTSIDKGGILFYPFVDVNNNGIKDEGEVMVLLTNVKASGARAYISEKDSIVRISNLNAFINYTIQFNDDDLDNIAWQFKHKTYQVLVDPHQYKRVYLPILALGEVTGMVYMDNQEETRGLARATVQIFDKDGVKVGETLSESDGYYSFMGLVPGEYTVRVDKGQLVHLDCKSIPFSHNFIIKELVEGDVVSATDFKLQSNMLDASVPNEMLDESSEIIVENREPELRKNVDTNFIATRTIVPSATDIKQQSNNLAASVFDVDTAEPSEITVENREPKLRANINPNFIDIRTTDEDFKTVQIGIYRNYVTADQLQNLEPIYYEVLANGTNRYYSGNFATIEEAEKARDQILAKGVAGAYVLAIEDGKANFNKEPVADVQTSRKNVNSSFIAVNTTDKLFHTVQIGIYRNYVTADQLQNLEPIYYEELANGTNRYFSGQYETREEAEKAREQILAKGVVGAYVLSIESGKQTEVYAEEIVSENLTTQAEVAVEPVANQLGEKVANDSRARKHNESSLSPSDNSWGPYSMLAIGLLLALVLFGSNRLLKRKS